MGRKYILLTLLSMTISLNLAREPQLPLCPTNIQYLPQKLPMHCRMPTAAEKAASNVIPMPMHGMNMGMPGPPPPVGMPGPGQVPLQMGMPMGFPYPMPPPAPKLPVIVMPFYSPDNSFKRGLTTKRPNHDRSTGTSSSDDDSDTDTDTDDTDTSSGSDDGFWREKKRKRHSKRRRGRKNTRRNNNEQRDRRRGDVLTPILQYMTKDGYVIYEKPISKGEAKDWLDINQNHIKKEETSVNTEKNKQEDAKSNEGEKMKEVDKEVSNHIDREKNNKKPHRHNIEPELTKLHIKKTTKNRKKPTIRPINL